jgi:hypothetical protein
VVGLAPLSAPGLHDDPAAYAALRARLWPGGAMAQVGRGRVLASDDLGRALRDLAIAPDFRFDGDADIPFVHRQWADGESYFLVNRRNRAEATTAHFRVTGKVPELWHAETGAIEPVSYAITGGETVVPITLPARGAVHVVFRKPVAAAALTVPERVALKSLTLAAPWQVVFQPNRGAPAAITMPVLQPLNRHADPAVRYFSGRRPMSPALPCPPIGAGPSRSTLARRAMWPR